MKKGLKITLWVIGGFTLIGIIAGIVGGDSPSASSTPSQPSSSPQVAPAQAQAETTKQNESSSSSSIEILADTNDLNEALNKMFQACDVIEQKLTYFQTTGVEDEKNTVSNGRYLVTAITGKTMRLR